MGKHKKMIRGAFRKAVFTRDGFACVKCGDKEGPFDAHHISDRTIIPKGGYVAENGITLCSHCHMRAEVFHISATAGMNGPLTADEWYDRGRAEYGWRPDDLYEEIGSSREDAWRASEERL